MATTNIRSLQQKMECVTTFIEGHGIVVHPTCRLAQMREVFLDEAGNVQFLSPSHPRFQWGLEALREFTLLEYTADNWPYEDMSPDVQRKLKSVLKDAVAPETPAKHSRGRDAQLELFVAAMCHGAGLGPVSMEEPDVICVVGGQRYGFAVKRPKSHNNLEELIGGGADQVVRSGSPGVVFVDTTLAFNESNERIIRPLSDSQFEAAHRYAMKKLIDAFHDRLQEWVRTKNVRAVYFYDSQVRQRPGSGWRLESLKMGVETTRGNARRHREFLEFDAAFAKAFD